MTSLANFLQTNGGSNILSRPSLLTLDNEEAKIVVGQNVPFVTGQYTSNNSNSGSVNPFQTVERKDVGLTLKVKPQISDTGTVKLTIYQEVSSVNSSRKDIDGLDLGRWLDEQCPLQDLRRQRVGRIGLAPLEPGQWRQTESHERF
jgi:type II secretory pathway component GspD/PulD (secretin)